MHGSLHQWLCLELFCIRYACRVGKVTHMHTEVVRGDGAGNWRNVLCHPILGLEGVMVAWSGHCQVTNHLTWYCFQALDHLNSMFCLLVVICEPSQLWHSRYVFFWYVSHSTTFYAQVCAVDSWSLYQSAFMAIWLICRTHSCKWGFSWNKQCSAYHTIIPSHQAPGVTRKFDLSAPKQSLDYNLII